LLTTEVRGKMFNTDQLINVSGCAHSVSMRRSLKQLESLEHAQYIYVPVITLGGPKTTTTFVLILIYF